MSQYTGKDDHKGKRNCLVTYFTAIRILGKSLDGQQNAVDSNVGGNFVLVCRILEKKVTTRYVWEIVIQYWAWRTFLKNGSAISQLAKEQIRTYEYYQCIIISMPWPSS